MDTKSHTVTIPIEDYNKLISVTNDRRAKQFLEEDEAAFLIGVSLELMSQHNFERYSKMRLHSELFKKMEAIKDSSLNDYQDGIKWTRWVKADSQTK